jgi:hypothetical protein
MRVPIRPFSRRRRAILAAAGVMLAACLVAASSTPQTPAAKANDLDAFMARVLETRDENWRKLHDYILNETETFAITSAGRLPAWSKEDDGLPLSGYRRDFMWYVRDGYLIRSPLRYDGVALSESERRAYEAKWLKEEQEREKKAREKAEGGGRGAAARPATAARGGTADSPSLKDLVDERGEPRFVSEAYFLRFKFEPGHYYLVGRETFEGRQVLRVEYYPSELFRDEKAEGGGRGADTGTTESKDAAAKPRKPKTPSEDTEDQKIERDMNKVSRVTLWIEPGEHQIVKYTFENTDFGFLPGRWLVRIDNISASMTMARAFEGVWLPSRISMQGALTFATGTYGIRYERRFYDYKKAESAVKIRILPPKRP